MQRKISLFRHAALGSYHRILRDDSCDKLETHKALTWMTRTVSVNDKTGIFF
jgi:hypothetical protein